MKKTLSWIIYLLVIWHQAFAKDQRYLDYISTSSKLNHIVKDVENQMITIKEALLQLNEVDIEMLIKPSPKITDFPLNFVKGKTLCSGTTTGQIYFTRDQAVNKAKNGGSVIWITDRLSNDDLCYVNNFKGVISFSEDPSSHASIVLRVFNIPSLTFIQDSYINNDKLYLSNGTIIHEGEWVSVDGFNEILIPGKIFIHFPDEQNKKILHQIMTWCKSYSKLEIHGNSDTPQESLQALQMGAVGIDPRSEHMFFQPERLVLFRNLIMLPDSQDQKILLQLMQLQKKDFIELFKIVGTVPIKIRLLDPPLHEFLPHDDETIKNLAKSLSISISDCEKIINSKTEVNPMMGHRGIRLLVTHPKIIEMQVQAIFEAAIESQLNMTPYINLPMVIDKNEILFVKKIIDEVLEKTNLKYNTKLNYKLGIMVETPRASLLADELAPYLDFISFGTNDLTGQTLALSRGDVYESFLNYYLKNNILDSDPFMSLDRAVQELIEITVIKMRKNNPNIIIGLCGEQGAEQKSVRFLCEIGLNSISCSPSRIPVVYLFAAQSEITKNQDR